MARLDKIHNAVRNALIKDGWKITADPLQLKYGEVKLQIDLAAEPTLAAEKDNQKIAVEIKSFLDPSLINDLKAAYGQYEIYLTYLNVIEPERKLFIGVDSKAYKRIKNFKGFELFLQKHQIPFIVIQIKSEEIIEWVN